MKKFIKNIENFSCFNCQAEITGNGYTNHCPECLWSLHVDITPGDRQNPCKGKMMPVKVICKTDNYKIIHICQSCKEERVIKVSEKDNFDSILALCKKTF